VGLLHLLMVGSIRYLWVCKEKVAVIIVSCRGPY